MVVLTDSKKPKMQPQKNPSWVSKFDTLSISREQNQQQQKMQNQQSFSLTLDEKLSIMEALDHIHVTRQYQEMGSCSVCKKISIKKCSACGTFYCSSECQTYDWPKHKAVCLKQRDGTSDRNAFGGSRMSAVGSVKNFISENAAEPDRGSPFAALTNQLRRKSGNDFDGNKSLTNFKIGNKQYQSREKLSKGNEAGNAVIDGKDNKKGFTFDKKKYSPPKKILTRKKSPADDKRGSIGQSNTLKSTLSNGKATKSSNESIPRSKSQPNLPKIGRMEVIATYRQSADRCWVMDARDAERFEQIQTALNSEEHGSINPKVGFVCSCIFGDEWFRGKVVSLAPEAVVHFIDFGNTSEYASKAFRRIPDNLHRLPGLAFLIEFDKNTPKRYRTADLGSFKFIIEETGTTADGVPRVRVVEEANEVEKKSLKSPPPKGVEKVTFVNPRSVMHYLKPTSKGLIVLLPGEGKTRYGTLVPEDNKEANEAVEKILKIDSPNVAPIEAQDGDYVLVTDKEGNDQRGKVLSNLGSTYYVQLIDCGNVISTDTVYPMPEDLKNLMELGVKITIETNISASKTDKLDTCFFSVTGESKSGKWPCTLNDAEYKAVAKISLEQPNEKVKWLPEYVSIKSGSTVEVSSSSPPNSLYIRAVDAVTEQQFLDMNMEMVSYAQGAQNFAIPPSPGELCCAKFKEDDCFYRGIVNSVDKNKASVLFVDFGNEQITDLDDVKPLPSSLKNFPFFAVKVRLSNVSRKPWNNMIKEYIGKLTSENVELTLTYEGSIRNGVILREKVSGIVVNEFIEKARDRQRLSHSLKSASDLSTKSEIFLDDDMKYTTVPSGSKCTLAILYVSEYEFETNYTFWATIAAVPNFHYVNLELNSLISEHCSVIKTPYEPGFRELCLAEFEGSWYRAICAGKEGNNFKVFFVDFGNVCEVKAASIRKMVKKFMKAPALAMNCTINGYEKLRNNPDLVEKVCGTLLEKVNTCFEDVTLVHHQENTFLCKIPEIEKIMVE